MTKKIVLTTITALVALSAHTSLHAAQEQEKCYGVVQAGLNDCGTRAHGCAGQSTENGLPSEWLFVPKGLCQKLVNGSLTPENE